MTEVVVAPSPIASAFAAALYGTVAVAMAFTNKAVLNWGFKETNALLLLQMIAAVLCVSAIGMQGAVKIAPLSMARARTLAPISALYCGNTAFALASLDGMVRLSIDFVPFVRKARHAVTEEIILHISIFNSNLIIWLFLFLFYYPLPFPTLSSHVVHVTCLRTKATEQHTILRLIPTPFACSISALSSPYM